MKHKNLLIGIVTFLCLTIIGFGLYIFASDNDTNEDNTILTD